MPIRLLCFVTLSSACQSSSCGESDRADAEAALRQAQAGEAEARARADARFEALAPAEHLDIARTIVQRHDATDPLATAASRRAELDEAERHLRAIPADAPELAGAAEPSAELAIERATIELDASR